jgi:pyruvate dehydrogenase E2 component (dihydrolipoamide acetyltransferase)
VYQDFELSDLALAVASRQVWAKQNVPHYYLSVDLNLSRVIQLREDLNKAAAGDTEAVRVSVLDFFVKASALAMKKVPDVNGAWNDTFVRRYSQVDINVVLDSPAGLVTPVVRNVSPIGIRQIAKELDSIEALATAGGDIDGSKIQLGTFSIHDLGKYGVKSAAPIVISPQSCALAIGAISDTVIPRVPGHAGEEAWQVAPMVTVTLSCDHRAVDGAVGAQWLAALKTLIEDPVTMIL